MMVLKDRQMKPASEDLLKGLLKITRAMVGIVSLLFVGTGVVVYLLLARPAAVEVQVPSEKADAAETTSPDVAANTLNIVDGKDVQTGLLDGEGLLAVKANCLACHSAKLVTQNRFTREGWHEKIVWMQKTQGLWDLGENESIILDYLAQHYAPEERAGRRQPLNNIEWYELKEGS